jgi:hypothetical protein
VSRTAWNLPERQTAALIDGRRNPASTRGAIDCEGLRCVAQVKERRALCLAERTRPGLDAKGEGQTRDKAGVVIAKHSAGQGRSTPFLVVATAVWRQLFGSDALPVEATS